MEALFFYLMTMYTSICAFTPESTEQVPDSLQYLCFTKADQQYIEDNLNYALKISNKECKKELKDIYHYYRECNNGYKGLFFDNTNDTQLVIDKITIDKTAPIDRDLLTIRGQFYFIQRQLAINKSLYDIIKFTIETQGNGIPKHNNSLDPFRTYFYKYDSICNMIAKEKYKSYDYDLVSNGIYITQYCDNETLYYNE